MQVGRSGGPNRIHLRCGSTIHLQLLSTSPRGDAVTFGYRSEGTDLAGTSTPRVVRLCRRTSDGASRRRSVWRWIRHLGACFARPRMRLRGSGARWPGRVRVQMPCVFRDALWRSSEPDGDSRLSAPRSTLEQAAGTRAGAPPVHSGSSTRSSRRGNLACPDGPQALGEQAAKLFPLDCLPEDSQAVERELRVITNQIETDRLMRCSNSAPSSSRDRRITAEQRGCSLPGAWMPPGRPR
jgi:hypothetical protein